MEYNPVKEGTLLSASVLAMEAPVTRPACRDCDWHDIPRVRFYLLVWRQARLAHEEFADVLRHRTRDSRSIEPSIRGKGFDMETARAVGWSLDQVARKRGIGFMHADNCEAVARELCQGR